MTIEIPTAVISTAISSSVAVLSSWLLNKRNAFKNEEQKILDGIQQINMLSISNPNFEDNDFCSAWEIGKKSKDIEYKKYDNYCCYLFNILELTWKHFGGDRSRIEKFIGIRELCQRHKKWWEDEENKLMNLDGYDPKFFGYMSTYYLKGTS